MPDDALATTPTEPRPPDADPLPLDRIRRAGGDALVARLVRLFLDTAPERLTTAERALADGDRETLLLAVHSLKSSCAQLGAMAASADLADAERAVAAGDLDPIAALLAAARESLGRYRSWADATR
jgi:HPt (histidine-containing phosphotransfer) domain-containing protein